MSKFRATVEAMQLTDRESFLDVFDWVSGVGGSVTIIAGPPRSLVVHTLQGMRKALEGDWVIQGVRGDFFPCGDDVFRVTYEAVE
jgi:hypothetical protein